MRDGFHCKIPSQWEPRADTVLRAWKMHDIQVVWAAFFPRSTGSFLRVFSVIIRFEREWMPLFQSTIVFLQEKKNFFLSFHIFFSGRKLSFVWKNTIYLTSWAKKEKILIYAPLRPASPGLSVLKMAHGYSLEENTAIQSSIFARRNPVDRGAWQAWLKWLSTHADINYRMELIWYGDQGRGKN